MHEWRFASLHKCINVCSYENAYFLMFSPIIHTKTYKDVDWNSSIDVHVWHLLQQRFQIPQFPSIHSRDGVLWSWFWKPPFSSAFLGHFSVDDRQKHINKCGFSYKQALVGLGPHSLCCDRDWLCSKANCQTISGGDDNIKIKHISCMLTTIRVVSCIWQSIHCEQPPVRQI